MVIDLHTHTTFSDGNLTLEELLSLAKNMNLSEIAITDHDTIINLENYKILENKYNLIIIPGIEISTNIKKLHLLGYAIKDFNLIETKLNKLKKDNEDCNRETIEILKSEKIDISFNSVKKLSNSTYLTYRDIVKYMYQKGYVKNPHDVYKKYIGEGTKAYVPSKELEVEEVLNLIISSGGLAVLAHPFSIKNNDLESLIIYMKNLGLEGIETPFFLTNKQLEILVNIIKKYDLVQTIGTDFHDFNYDKLGVDVENKYLEKFHSRILKKWR